ncbi:MAG: CCA tRNA nucleotidyltransferase [Rhodospirillaceae bacterium]|nr:CCA tRNA nucleotidyltransferase [Rhodospirillaceae bacterium]
MKPPATKTIINALIANKSDVRFVGGCVRDAILNRSINDIDIATTDHPKQVLKLLNLANINVISTDITHGTTRAIIDKMNFEITTLRSDVETFGRNANVKFINDWNVDATRRDFTINAIFCCPDGIIFDPLGGLEDLHSGCVRFIGIAQKRIEEDILRILRYFRFYAYYASSIDTEALDACRTQAYKLSNLSGERLCNEMMKIFLSPNPVNVLLLMRDYDVLKYILPQARDFKRLSMLVSLENNHFSKNPLRRLASILSNDLDEIITVAKRFNLSRNMTNHLIAMTTELPNISTDNRTIRRIFHKVGTQCFIDIILLSISSRNEDHISSRWLELLNITNNRLAEQLPIHGQDLIDLGVPSGPKIGTLLTKLEYWWEDNDCAFDRNELLIKLKELLILDTVSKS